MERMSPSEYQKYLKKGKGTKYKNHPTKMDGYNFASQFECSVYAVKKLEERAGITKVLQVQKQIYFVDSRTGGGPLLGYRADLLCLDVKSGEEYLVEAKGKEGERWLIIQALWYDYGTMRLEIWKGDAARPKLWKTIIPGFIPPPECPKYGHGGA